MTKKRTHTPETIAKIRAAASATIRARVAARDWHGPGGPSWREDEDALLGTMPDGLVAARTGRSLGSVAARRHKLGIAPAQKRGRPVGWRKAKPAPDPNRNSGFPGGIAT